jgi:hypothetical protein
MVRHRWPVGGAVFDRPGGPKPVRITPLGAVVLTQGRDLLAKTMAAAIDRFKAGAMAGSTSAPSRACPT